MSEADGWTWKIGILNGIGSAAWQELSNKVRRITQLISVENGLMPSKCCPSIGAKDKEPQFDAFKLVIVDTEPDEKLAEALDRVWGGIGLVVPRNGKMPNLRIT